MKKLSLLAAALVAALLFTTQSASAASIVLTTPFPISGEFTVNVVANNIFDGHDTPGNTLLWAAFDVNISNPSAVQYIGAASGGGQLLPNDNSLGYNVFVQSAALTGIPQSTTSLLLAVLVFRTLGNGGPVTISVTGDPSDGLGGLQFLNDLNGAPINGSIDLRATSPVPEPATLLLSGIGLIGLAAARLRARR